MRHITFNSLRWKITALILLVVLGFNFLMQLIVWVIETSHSDMGNRPIKDWLEQAIVHPAEQLIDESAPAKLGTFLSALCNSTGHSVNHSGQRYADVAIGQMYLLDETGEYRWSCNGILPEQNAFMHLPISSRDDVADAISKRYNSGVESVRDDRYLVVKGLYKPDGSIHRILVSEQVWTRSQGFNLFLYYPLAVLKRGVAWSVVSLLIAFIPALLLAYLFASGVLRKVNQITRVISEWASGNFDARLRVTTKDSFGNAMSQLNQMASKLRSLVESKQTVAEKAERERIAAELHDTVKQLLYANNLQLAAVQSSLESNKQTASAILQQAIATNKKAFSNINLLIDALKPIDWNNQNLSDVLIQEIARWGSDKHIDIEVDIEPGIRLSADASYVFYRCVHETLQNIVKHSQASHVSVAMQRQGTQLVCTIKDNGVGLNHDHNMGQGLLLMRSRLESMNGSLTLSSQQGCEVVFSIEVAQ